MSENQITCFAFLRAINVGGHTVKKETLCQPFLEENLTEVKTFLASGNVIFNNPSRESGALEQILEARMRLVYGFQTSVFIRSLEETAHLLAYPVFPSAEIAQAGAYNLAFLQHEPDAAAVERLMSLGSDMDRIHVYGRQVYWLCAVKQSQSTFSNTVLEKVLGMQSTLRGMNTLHRLVEMYR